MFVHRSHGPLTGPDAILGNRGAVLRIQENTLRPLANSKALRFPESPTARVSRPTDAGHKGKDACPLWTAAEVRHSPHRAPRYRNAERHFVKSPLAEGPGTFTNLNRVRGFMSRGESLDYQKT